MITTRSTRPATPRRAAERESLRRGPAAFAEACADLLWERSLDAALVEALGGAHARRVLDDGLRDDQRYWLRVWAARGLLWAWHDVAVAALLDALADEHWRVREMAAKVAARHLLGEALPTVAGLCEDPVPRVRSAATRAVQALLPS